MILKRGSSYLRLSDSYCWIGMTVNGSAPHELDHYDVTIRESFAFCFPIIK